MVELPARRSPSEILKRGYSDEEIGHLYELGRFYLENGNLRAGEAILHGLTEVAPEYSPAWLGMCYVHILAKNYDAAIYAARQALRVEPNFAEAILFLASCFLTTGDFNAAGTYLGEVGEMIDSGNVDSPNIIRFYKAQLARFQNR